MTIRKRTALNGDTWWRCPACGAIHAVKTEAMECCGWQGDDEAASARQIGGDHYTTMTVQPWDAMQSCMTPEAFAGYLRGNAIKYLMRAGSKGPAAEDYAKARHYLDKLMEAAEALTMARGTTD